MILHTAKRTPRSVVVAVSRNGSAACATPARNTSKRKTRKKISEE